MKVNFFSYSHTLVQRFWGVFTFSFSYKEASFFIRLTNWCKKISFDKPFFNVPLEAKIIKSVLLVQNIKNFFLGVVHLSCVKLLYDIFIWSINLSSLLQTVSVNAFVFCFKIFFTQFCLRRRQILLLIHSVFWPKVYFFPYSPNLFIQIANDRILMFLNVVKR